LTERNTIYGFCNSKPERNYSTGCIVPDLEKRLQLIRYGRILGLISGAFGVTDPTAVVVILRFFSFALLGEETGTDPSAE
jgi:hypothetical protein